MVISRDYYLNQLISPRPVGQSATESLCELWYTIQHGEDDEPYSNKNWTCSFVNQLMTLYHGTNRLDFMRFDMSHVEPFNIGLHFGTETAARSRIDYLRQKNPTSPFRILKCEVEIRNPLRVEDIFGHSYAGAFSALQDESIRQSANAGLRHEIDVLANEWMASDDDPTLTGSDSAHAEYYAKLNREIVRLFKTLGFDGLVYVNELEDGESKADSYVLFDVGQICDER